MTTFRDLALETDRNLIAATSRLGVLSQPDAAQVAGELAELSRICVRVLEDVLDGSLDGSAPSTDDDTPGHTREHADEGAAWRAVADTGRLATTAAQQRFERAAKVYGPTGGAVYQRMPPCAVALRSAIRPLRQAEEILQKELLPDDRGHRRSRHQGPYGPGDPDLAREITGLAGRWIGILGAVADRLAGQVEVRYRLWRPDAEPITQILQQAAANARHARQTIAREVGPVTQLSQRLAELATARSATPAHEKPVPELVQEYLAGADDQAAALRGILNAGPTPGRRWHGPGLPESPMSAPSLRYVANLAGSVHTAAAIIARQLAARVAELTGTTRGSEFRALARAADALIASGRAWDTAARRWDLVTSRDVQPSNRVAEAATGTVMRLGHAAYADPGWTPISRNTTVRPATEFATNLDAIRKAAAHLNRVVTAYTGAAHASGNAITTLHQKETLLTHPGEQPSDDPARASDTDIADLREAYATVIHQATTAQRWLEAAHAPAIRDPADAPRLAAADFPNQPLARPDATTPAPATTSAPAPPAASPAASALMPGSPSVPVPAAATAQPVRRAR